MTWFQSITRTLVLVVLATASAAAQSDNARLLDSADALMRSADTVGAQPLYERALEAGRQAGREPEIARALLGLGQIAQRRGHSADGRAAVVEALAIFERLVDREGTADASYALALIERAAQNRAAAVRLAARALAIYDEIPHQRGIALATMELADLQDLDLDAAGQLFERAAAAARAAGDASLEGEALHSFGDRLFGAGRYEQSLDLLTRAAAVFDAAKETKDLGTVYNSIGRVYRAHGRLDEALKYQKAALELHRTTRDPFMLLQSLNAVAVVYQRQKNLATARSYLEEALEVAATLPPTPAAARAADFLRANMADILSDLGQFAPAAAALEQVIANGRDSFRSERYGQLAQVYIGLGRGVDALAAAEQAVTLCGASKVTCIGALNARSDAHAALGNRDAARRDLELTLKTIEDLRAQLVPSDFFKQGFSRYYEAAYGSAIARQLDSGLEREALETAELARSRAFLDLLASRAIAPPAAAGPALPLTLRGGAAAGVASPVTTAPANANDLLRTAARLRSTLLLYWVGAGETMIWVVTPDGQIHARRVKVAPARLTALVRDTAPFASARGDARTTTAPVVLQHSSAAWRDLYTLLIAPVRTLLPNTKGALLTIVPHEALLNLSFAALQNQAGRYLLEDYTLHYAPAGALFQFTAAQGQPHPRASTMLIVADPEPARRSTLDAALPRLPGARMEAAAIARQLQAGRVMALRGAAATESRVRAQAPGRSILHFAAHTVVRDDDPFASYLALSRSSGGEEGDGVLTAQDVYGLKLSADLVVLSACRSASGTIAGDGVATFARAFMYAGAASLVASVWDVADEPSNRLLPAFYRAWLGGATKAAALRQAQLRLLADLRLGRVRVTTPVGPVPVPEHPVFWAGFTLFGEPD
jgi:CHAT domain-containing protein/tetratricopeptide (TPR) repeat protein